MEFYVLFTAKVPSRGSENASQNRTEAGPLWQYNMPVLEFALPIWLGVPAAVGVLGAWTLWRGQRRSRSVSSLKLWRGLEMGRASKQRRVVDPLWVLILLAGVLAGAALAGPRWVRHVAPPLPVNWSVRMLPQRAGQAEAWIRCAEIAGEAELRINGKVQRVTAAELARGLAVAATPDAQGIVQLELRADGREAVTRFRNEAGRALFGLIEAAPAGQPMDPALHKVFGMQARAPAGGSEHTSAGAAAGAAVRTEELEEADLVIALPGAELPGLTLGAERTAPAGGWTPVATELFDWPKFVPLKDVHVAAVREVAYTGPWVMAAVIAGGDGNTVPWILVRQARQADGREVMWLWLASLPSGQTDWPKSPGFVVFFAEMQQRVLGVSGGVARDFVQVDGEGVRAGTLVALDGYAGWVALGLVGAGMIWFLARAR